MSPSSTYLVGLGEFDGAESLGAAVRADDDVCADNVASTPHVILQVLPADLVRQVADEHLSGLCSARAKLNNGHV